MRTPLCEKCKLPHPPLVDCVEAQAQQMKKLLLLIGDVGQCSRCHATIFWLRHSNGKAAAYTEAGLNHFVDCPYADEFKTKGGSRVGAQTS